MSKFALNLGVLQPSNTREVQRYLVGIDGTLGYEDWSWGAYYQYGEVETKRNGNRKGKQKEIETVSPLKEKNIQVLPGVEIFSGFDSFREDGEGVPVKRTNTNAHEHAHAHTHIVKSPLTSSSSIRDLSTSSLFSSTTPSP